MHSMHRLFTRSNSKPSDNADQGRYNYSELPSARHIRLLVLKSANYSKSMIACEIRLLELRSLSGPQPPHNYEALSYCWGDNTRSKMIKVIVPSHATRDAYWQMHITASLHGALLALRLKSQDRILWADAVCINQDCEEEKLQQLPMMAEIYSRASQVPIWLGGDGETEGDSRQEISLAVKALNRLEWRLNHESKRYSGDDEGLATVRAMEDCYSASSLFKSRDWSGLIKFFQRPWFQRMWVFQEVACARKAFFLWGDSKVEWKTAMEAAAGVRTAYAYSSLPVEGIFQPATLFVASSLANRIFGDEHAGVFLLHTTRRRLCQHPQDKYAAVQSMVPSFWPKLTNYAVDVVSLYTDIATSLLESDNIKWLSNVWNPPDPAIPQLPSWVTDLSWNKLPDEFLGLSGSFDATLGRAPQFEISEDRRKLAILGKRIGCVKVVAHEFLTELSTIHVDHVIPYRRLIFRQLKEILSIYDCETRGGQSYNSSDYDDGDSYTDDFPQRLAHIGKELVCERSVDSEPAGRREELDCFTFSEYYMPTPGLPPGTLSRKEEVALHESRGYYHGALRRWSRGRSFFITEDRRIGWAPPGAKPGDLVVLLYGLSVPFILKPRERAVNDTQSYRLIGECYLKGVMNGEAMDSIEFGNQETSFEIT